MDIDASTVVGSVCWAVAFAFPVCWAVAFAFPVCWAFAFAFPVCLAFAFPFCWAFFFVLFFFIFYFFWGPSSSSAGHPSPPPARRRSPGELPRCQTLRRAAEDADGGAASRTDRTVAAAMAVRIDDTLKDDNIGDTKANSYDVRKYDMDGTRTHSMAHRK